MTHAHLAGLSRPVAWIIGCLTLTLAGAGLLSLRSADEITRGPVPVAEESDWELYRGVLARLQAGEGYYNALGGELRARGYPTRSPFSWRTPLHLWLLGRLPHPVVGQVVLGAVCLLSLFLTWRLLEPRHGPAPAAAGLVFLVGAFVPCFVGDVQLFAEVWSGAFLVCSALLGAHDRWRAAVALGLVAILLRELALPYLVIALALAAWNRRRGEALAWAGAIGVFAAYLGVHAWVVSGLLTPADHGFEGGWIRLGGLGFVLSTARMHAFLLVLPVWVTALYVPLALLGLLAWPERRALSLRLSGIAFVAAFFVVGRPENFYWGPLYTPLLALGIVWAPAALRDLARAVRPRHRSPRPRDSMGAR